MLLMLMFVQPAAAYHTISYRPVRTLVRAPTSRAAVPNHSYFESLGVAPTSIEEERIFDGQPFPLTLVPTASKSEPLVEWVVAHRDALLGLVEKYDAVLLRGFANANSAMDFSKFAAALQLGDFEMGCSAAPRTNLAPGVFTANEAPPSEPIPFHHVRA